MATHYQLLGVSPHASHDEIRRAYHRQARRHHPDANVGEVDDEASARARRAMSDVNLAWEVLSDPERRRAYDRAIGTTPRPQFSGAGGAAARRRGDPDDDLDDDLDHLRDEPEVYSPPRPADLLMLVPVLLLVTAVATFAFSAMTESEGLRTLALLMAPVTAASFVAAPLLSMLRARSRDY